MEPSNKKVKFSSLSPGSLQQFENQVMNMHDIAMGYASRPVEDNLKNKDLIQLAMNEFPVPPELHGCFLSWIRKNKMARFNCHAINARQSSLRRTKTSLTLTKG